ncbi:hypothetical protein LVD15_12455 [Fulvivirga maritima]|uniref:hypothetical protein n=1 Tax=Fulvivirga maritima TaxID=2904247 RepID=UPI001F39CF31|nr:hypothetical protein [Fulvivirga maritima]UII29197.1 hypothetical protein LVD15_12455 [Fulvivirga maritima]
MLKLSILLIMFPLLLSAQEKMVKTKVNDNITAKLPENFYPMSADDIAQRYPSVRKPLAAYTDDSRYVGFSINISATQWMPTDAAIAKDFFKASLFNLYDKVEVISEGIKEINGREFIYFEFDSQVNGEQHSFTNEGPMRKYAYVQYLIVRGKTIVFSFNCPLQLKAKWQQAAGEIMNSLKVKGSL